MQILFELTASQRDMIARAGLDPGVVPLRNMRLRMGDEEVWAKCPVIGSGLVSETVVLPNGQVLTKLAKGRT